MASIGSLSVSSIEEAFGLNPGDLKLVSDTAVSSTFLAKNGWTELESIPLRATRLEVMRGAFVGHVASVVTKLVGGVFEFAPGGISFVEYFVHNMARIYNCHVNYEVVAYVNENCRLMHPFSTSYAFAPLPLSRKPTVEKMAELVLVTICKDKCKEEEIIAYQLDGPNKDEYEDYKTCGNWGQLLVGLTKIDLDREVTSCSPKLLRQKKEQLNA